MKKSTKLFALLTAVMMMATVCLPAFADTAIDTIMSAGTTQAFTDEPVKEEDLETILKAGIAAASAINQQPWYFVAVTNKDIMGQLTGGSSGMPSGMPAGGPSGMPEGAPAGMPEGAPAGGMPGGFGGASGAKAALGDSPAAIIIYMNSASMSPDASFDCGLATQNMYIAATALGYGVKIVSSPTMTLNGSNHDALCELLGVDKSLQALAVMLIGYPEVDAETTATTRGDFANKAAIIK